MGKDKNGADTLEVQAPPGRALKLQSGRLYVVRRKTAAGGPSDSTDPSDSGGDEAMEHIGVPVDLTTQDCKFSKDEDWMMCRLHENHVQEVKVRYVSDEL